MNLGPVRALYHVPVRDDSIESDEKAASPRQFFSATVKGFDGHSRRLYAPDKLRQTLSLRQRERGAGDEHQE
jgi:hypothetical protein